MAGPPIRTGLSSLSEGLKGGKEGAKPVVILFLDTTPKSKQWSIVLGDKALDDAFGKVVYVAIDFKKDGEDEKKYEVTSAPTLLLIDPTKEDSKPKKISSPSPGSLKKEIDSMVKSMAAKK